MKDGREIVRISSFQNTVIGFTHADLRAALRENISLMDMRFP